MYGVADAGCAVAKPREGRLPASLISGDQDDPGTIFASATAATSPMPDVPPVITTVFPLMTLWSLPLGYIKSSSEPNIPYPFRGTRRAEADNRYSHIVDRSHYYRNARPRPASKRGVF